MNATQTVGADWELDFYSRPILEADGRKRWALLVTATPAADAKEIPFRFSKCCPSGEVNSLWLTAALGEDYIPFKITFNLIPIKQTKVKNNF